MRLFAFIFFTLTMAACNQKDAAPENFDYGTITDSAYSNKYFGFHFLLPQNWHVQNKEQMANIEREGRDLIAEKNKPLAQKMKAADIKSAALLSAFKYRDDTLANDFNASFAFLAENISSMPGDPTGKDYLVQAKSIMKTTGLTYQFPSDFYSEQVGNQQFTGMDVVMTVKGIDVGQSYYSLVSKKFALTIIISYGSEEQKKELKDIINRIKFIENSKK